MIAADLVAEILRKEKISVLPSFPHSDLIESAAKIGIRPIIVRQERHALHIADGYARSTGGRKICCTTVQYGPGSENATGAVAQCFADNVPLLHLPVGYPRDAQATACNFSAAHTMQSFTKRCELVSVAERIPQQFQHAFAMVRNGRPGPVVLELPVDLLNEPVDPSLLERYQPQTRSAPVASEADVEKLLAALHQAERPVIVAGQGVLYGAATEELLQLSGTAAVPVLSTLNGKSAFPENHPLALGCAGGARPDTVNSFLDQADFILGIGTSFTRSEYITPFPTAGKVFAQLTNWEGDIAVDYPIEIAVLGDVKASLALMNEALAGQQLNADERRQQLEVEIATCKASFRSAWHPLLTSEEIPINPYRVIWEIDQAVDKRKTILTHDAGSPRDQVTPFYEALVPHGYVGWGKTTQLGLGLGLMHGAKLANPDHDCINIMGDAAIGMVGMDLETAARCNIGTTTVVLRNSVMGGYTEYHPTAAQEYGIEQLGGDYLELAKALGCHAQRIERPNEIRPALAAALAENAAGRPALIEAITSEESRMARDLPQTL